MVIIANPIYDVVFRYLMDDNKIAKLMISKIIGEEIVELDFQPTEHISKTKRKKKQRHQRTPGTWIAAALNT